VKLKKIENPWTLPIAQLRERCVRVGTYDGGIYEVEFYTNEGEVSAVILTTRGIFGVSEIGWHLLGWTFYEEVKPLVWEGECLTGPYGYAFMLPSSPASLPEQFLNKRFRVVATEIVGGEDAEA
jgi:hypothetical protein